MNRYPYGWRMNALGLGFLLLTGFVLAQDDPDDGPGKGIFDQGAEVKEENPPPQEGVEAQAMGVVHEAFASPTVFAAQAGNPVATEPPAAIEEMPPEQKPEGENVQWINGYFAHEEQKKDFYWVSGIWRNIPPNMEWVPGAWNRVTDGWQYYSGFWRRANEGELVVVPTPPEPLKTADPPAPNAESTYVPGCWVYRQARYIWRPACWVPHRPGWVWVPARYVATHCGYVFVDGYWDYTIRDRGLLYCPVYINANFYRRPGWIYRPTYVVHDQCLLSCLFVQRRTGCYHFGNYYDPYYRNAGYTAWTSYRVNQHHEPLFSHYRHVHRRDPRWEFNLVTLYNGRYNGTIARPPQTLIQQTTIINNNVNITQINNLTLIAPATRINRKVVPLTKLDAGQLQQQALAAKQMREAAALRAKNEASLAKKFGKVKIGDPAKTLALNLPKTTQTTVLTTKIKNLPPPPPGQKAQGPADGGKTVGTDKGVKDKDKVAPGKDKVAPAKDKDKVTPGKDKVAPAKDKDKVAPSKDKVAPTKDKATPSKDKVVTPTKDKDKVTPIKDKVVVPTKDKVTPSKDKVVTPTKDKDKVAPSKDKVAPSKDKVAPSKDKVSPSKDKVTPAKDKDKVAPSKDKATPSKDKGVTPTKDKVTPSKDKVVVPTKDKDKVTPNKDKVTPAKDKDKVAPSKDKATPSKDKVVVPNKDKVSPPPVKEKISPPPPKVSPLPVKEKVSPQPAKEKVSPPPAKDKVAPPPVKDKNASPKDKGTVGNPQNRPRGAARLAPMPNFTARLADRINHADARPASRSRPV